MCQDFVDVIFRFVTLPIESWDYC